MGAPKKRTFDGFWWRVVYALVVILVGWSVATIATFSGQLLLAVAGALGLVLAIVLTRLWGGRQRRP